MTDVEIKIGILTVSDRANEGVYEDISGKEILNVLNGYLMSSWKPVSAIVPDNYEDIKLKLMQLADKENCCLIFTTGGTGIGPRDISPEVVRSVIKKEVPGIMEHIRLKYGSEKPNALLSRGICGVADKTIIFALPGSVKAVNEYMEEICKSLRHMIYMLHGLDMH